VAEACGLTVAGLLHHVGSKDGLLVAVLEHRDEEDVRALAEILGATTDQITRGDPMPSVTLADMCDALVERNSKQPEIVMLYSVLEAESLSSGHPAYDYFYKRQVDSVNALERLAPTDDNDPHGLAEQVIALMDGLQLQWLRSPDSFDLVEAWQRVSRRIPALQSSR
jgi:AcrR family transcriptional regulator